jgi:hypothetical protein
VITIHQQCEQQQHLTGDRGSRGMRKVIQEFQTADSCAAAT